MEPSRIAVAGASGLIGGALVRSLTADGHEVVRLVRRAPRAKDEVRWDPEGGRVDRPGSPGATPWSTSRARAWATAAGRTRTRRGSGDSRVLGTATLAEAVAALDEAAAGVRQRQRDGLLRRDRRPGGRRERAARDGASCRSCAWSGRGRRRRRRRRAYGPCSRGRGWWWPARAGPGGGCSRCSRRGSGGRMGDGRQYWSYISLHDEVAAIRHLIDTDGLSGPFNLTAPNPLTNREITAAMGRVLHRPTLFPVPAPGAADGARRDGGGRAGQRSGCCRSGCWSRASRSRSRTSRRRSGRRSDVCDRMRPPCDRALPMRDCPDRSRPYPRPELGYPRSLLGA